MSTEIIGIDSRLHFGVRTSDRTKKTFSILAKIVKTD
jgi:hypothetical protein